MSAQCCGCRINPPICGWGGVIWGGFVVGIVVSDCSQPPGSARWGRGLDLAGAGGAPWGRERRGVGATSWSWAQLRPAGAGHGRTGGAQNETTGSWPSPSPPWDPGAPWGCDTDPDMMLAPPPPLCTQSKAPVLGAAPRGAGGTGGSERGTRSR